MKVIHTKASREFDVLDWVNDGLADPDCAFTIKQRSQNCDSVFIMSHLDELSQVIYIQPYIENFRVTSEDAGNQTYPGAGYSKGLWMTQFNLKSY